MMEDEWMSLPKNRRAIRTLFNNGKLHPAMKMAENAIKMERSPNQVFILMVGETGAGKTSTINYLFGTEIGTINDTQSETRSTIEYTIEMRSEEWRIPDLKLSFVDSPGFGDTDGIEQDAQNVLSIKKFFEQHPNIRNSYPNIVMIVLNIMDNRIKGDKSRFSKTLKGIDRINVVDKSNPNIVVVLTHACSIARAAEIWQKRVDQKKEMVKSIVLAHLGVDPTVVVQENLPEDNELREEGDWHILPNGDKQPKILFVACRDLLNNIKDEIGHEAIAVCFRSITDKTVCRGLVTESSKVNKKEVDEMCKQLERSLVIRNELEIAETHMIWGLESNIGQGFNMFTDSPTLISPLRLQGNASRYRENVNFLSCDSYEIQCDTIQSDRQYKENRLNILNLSVCKDINYGALSMGMRAGYNKTSNPRTTRILSFSLEHRIGKFVLSKPYALNTFFIGDVRNLPSEYDANNESNLMKWKAFIEKWGSHIIVDTYIGGSLTGDVELIGSKSEELQISTHKVHAALKAKILFLSGSEESRSEDENTKLERLSSLSLSWSGGDPELHKANLDQLNENDWMGWIKSLKNEPAPLVSSLKLYPMHKLISQIDQNRGAECKKAINHALKGKLTHHDQPPVVDNRNTTARSNQSKSCFHEDSMVMVSSGKQKRMKDLQTEDKILIMNNNGVITEDKVLAWLHRVEIGRYNFLQLTHKFGEIRITEEHIVFRTKNQTPCQAVFLKPGDEIIMVKQNGDQDDFRLCQVPILSIQKVVMTGLYAPLTYSGRLIVDGIAVSCYCKMQPIQIGGFDIISPHDIAHFGMMPMRIAHCLGIDINDGKMDKQTGIHRYAKWLMKMFLR